MSPLRRLLLSHALAAVAMSLPWPLLLLLVSDRVGTSPTGDLLLGLTGAARMLPYVALSWASGALADRFRRDRVVRATLVTRLLLLMLVAVALADGSLLVGVLAAAGAVGCGTPAYPALAAAIPVLARERRRRATELLVTVEVASFVVGPAIGGLLLMTSSRGYIPAAAVVTTGVALLLIHGVRLPSPVHAEVEPSSTRAVLRTARRTSVVRRAIGTAALLNGVLAAVGLTLLPMATAGWGGGGNGFGLATAVLGFGALAAPMLWRVGRTSADRTRSGLLLLSGGLVVVPATPHVGWAVPALALVGAAAVHVEGAVTETIQDAVPDAQRAGAIGLTDSAMVGAALLGSLSAPLLVAVLGPRVLLVLLAAAVVTVVATPLRRPGANGGAQPLDPAGLAESPAPFVPTQRGPGRQTRRVSGVPEWRPPAGPPAHRPARSSSAAAPRG